MKGGDYMNYRSNINQKILGDFVAREVTMNATLLVRDLLDKGLVQNDDMQNLYYYLCPECGGDMEEIWNQDKDDTYYECTSCEYQFDEGIEPDQEAKEVYEWWFVTEWLCEKLKAQGEVVIDSQYGYLWGRCTTGQAILLDGVIGRIAEELEILEGQRNDWSKQ
jgi:DNA-directed RNA polymerase subunit RPC12/RpoP